MKIVKANEVIDVSTLNILIYGEPGSGKTSLACTASNPLILDFDNGAHRSAFRKDTLIIDTWASIVNEAKEFYDIISRYDTIVMDTVDTCLDYIGVYIVSQDPKLAKNKLQFYGRLKDEFTNFINRLKTMKKDIIMVAHVKEKDEGDARIKRPAITGGSYDRVLQVADQVGYLYIENKNRVLNFDPNEFWIGKNSAGIPQQNIPNFVEDQTYMDSLIKKMRDKLCGDVIKQQEAIKTVSEYQSKVIKANSLEELNNIIQEIKGFSEAIKRQIWVKVQEAGNRLGADFDKTSKQFIAKPLQNGEKAKPDK